MNTWVSYAENIEAMEKQLNNKIKIESLELFNMQLNGMLLQFETKEFYLMCSINNKALDGYTKNWHLFQNVVNHSGNASTYNRYIINRYAER